MEPALLIHESIRLIRKHANECIDAVRGVQDPKSIWYSQCKDLEQNCSILLTQLDTISERINRVSAYKPRWHQSYTGLFERHSG